MMKKVLFIQLLLLVGCSDFFLKEVDVPHTITEPKLVVHSYISQDEPDIRVALSMSVPVFGHNQGKISEITDATVVLYDEKGNKITLPYASEEKLYKTTTATFPIQSGINYRLEVISSRGDKVWATCQVPEKLIVPLKNVHVIDTKSEGSDAFQLAFEFKDAPNQRNYYLVTATLETEYGDRQEVYFKHFTDNNRDGEIIAVRSDKKYGRLHQVKRVYISLYSIDFNYYEYNRTVLLQRDTQDLGPFAEPVFIKTNVENGIGVFGAYRVKHYEVAL